MLTWWATRCVLMCLRAVTGTASGRAPGAIRVLVVGLAGARVLNQTMPQVAGKLGAAVTIWHQSGKGGQQTVQQAYADAGQPQHKVTEFIDDMAAAYARADVVVCRSGALTVSEIAAAGLPALFVPFQHKDRQQYWNALPLEKAGAAKFSNSLSSPSMPSCRRWLAGIGKHCWIWRNERVEPRFRMLPNG